MEMEIKTKGITRRWFANVFLILFCVVTVLEVIICISLKTYYYENVQNLAAEYAQAFSMLSTAQREDYPEMAREYAEQFKYKDKIEVQILDSDGNILFSTSGFQPEQEEMPDYIAATKSTFGTATRQIKTSRGEQTLCSTTILADYGNGSNGAYRWKVSLTDTNRHVALLCLVCILIGIALLLFSLFSGLYFITSIVRPVREVSNMARKIAMGDFDARLEVKSNNEIGELCDAINYMASELSQAENMKNDFISSVSHELRTPLTAIRGWGETAKMSLGTDDELVSKGIDVMLGEADRLSKLVEELLDFSRIQSGRLSIDTRPLRISTILQEAVDMYIELARQQNIELSLMLPKQEPPVMGDPNRLKQVFINIIDNAIKYTDAGGQVLVEQYEEEGCVLTKVSDTGVGIPAQDIDRVKEKFFKSNKTVRGSGIGLAVADEIVKQHKGLLFVESKEGVGTTVTIVLPIWEEPEDETAKEEFFPPVEHVSTEEPVDSDLPDGAEEMSKEPDSVDAPTASLPTADPQSADNTATVQEVTITHSADQKETPAQSIDEAHPQQDESEREE